ncbi:hypothetical protein ACJX0J_039945, partial [Zea mays]
NFHWAKPIYFNDPLLDLEGLHHESIHESHSEQLLPMANAAGDRAFLYLYKLLPIDTCWYYSLGGRNADKPVALSIVQARLVGLAHFSVGYIFTYAAFLIASTSGKFG